MKKSFSAVFLLMAVLFTVCLIASNLFAIKVFSIGSITMTGAVVIFPISYILNDCFTEVWGYQKARFVIWMAFAMNFLVVLIGQLVVWLPDAPFWNDGEHFNYVFNLAPKVVFASFLAFIVGSTANAVVMSKMKVAQQGKRFGIRAITSTIIGEGLDSLVFIPIVFWGTPIKSLLVMMFCQVSIKVLYEIIILPLTSFVVSKLKEKEGTDTFDENISYNPFKITDI